MIGRPAAMSVPSMTNSTIAATTSPTASPLPNDLGHRGGDGRGEVDLDAVDRRGGERRHEGVLGLGGDRGLGGVEHHRGDRGAAVLGHEAHALPRARAASRRPRACGVSVASFAGAASISAWFVADGRPPGVDVRLAVGELLRARVDLGLLGLDGRLAGVQLAPGPRSSLAWPASRSRWPATSCARPASSFRWFAAIVAFPAFELLLVGGDRRQPGVDLLLLGGELLPPGVELGLTRDDLRHPGVELRLPCVELRPDRCDRAVG